MIDREIIHHCRYSVHHPQKGGVENFGLNLKNIFKKVHFTLPGDITPDLVRLVQAKNIPIICDYHSVLDWPEEVKTIGFQHGCAQLRGEITGETMLKEIGREQVVASKRRNAVWVADSQWVSDMCEKYYGRSAEYIIYHAVSDDFFRNSRTHQRVPVTKVFHDARLAHKGRDIIPVLQEAFPKISFIQLQCKHSKIIDVLKDCDVFMHLSKYEGNSIMCNEVMALNIPLVTTDVGLFHEDLGVEEIRIVPVGGCFGENKDRLIEIFGQYVSALNNRKIGVEKINQWHQSHATNAHNEILWRQVVEENFPVISRSPVRAPQRRFGNDLGRILLSHHWHFQQIPAGRFSQDIRFISHDGLRPAGDSRVTTVPFGQRFDVAELVEQIPGGWEPDLFIAKVDAFFNQVPVNVGSLKCPKVLILGDTQHGEKPLQRMIQYAKSEQYDFYITDHKRHHLWYFYLAGLRNLYWLPGLFLNPLMFFDLQKEGAFGQHILQPPENIKISPESFQDKMVFIGQHGQFHPRRHRIINRLSQRFPYFVAQQLPQYDSFLAYNHAPVSLNISLNGDLNLRVLEVIAANGLLLTDQLSDESGLSLILEEGRDYAAYSDIEELEVQIEHLTRSPDLLKGLRKNAFEKYLEDLSPQVMQNRLFELVDGGSIDKRFSVDSVNRIQLIEKQPLDMRRIKVYEIIQDLHRNQETVDILFDAEFSLSSVADFMDLPRVNIFVYNYDESYVNRLSGYLVATGQVSRVKIASLYQVNSSFDVIISSRIDLTLKKFLKLGGRMLCNDFEGIKVVSRIPELQETIKKLYSAV